jgi:hypothetical protein
VAFAVPPEWSATIPAAPAGIAFSGQGAGATDPAGGGIVAGLVDTTRPDLLPAVLAADAPDPETIRIGGDAMAPGHREVPVPGGLRTDVTAGRAMAVAGRRPPLEEPCDRPAARVEGPGEGRAVGAHVAGLGGGDRDGDDHGVGGPSGPRIGPAVSPRGFFATTWYW